MKIDDKNVLSSSLQNLARATQAKGSTPPALSEAPAGSPSDAVDLSTLTRIFSYGLAAGEAARDARIEQLRQIYVHGQQTIDAKELSRAIISAHLSGD